jgi:hypothetical protein
VQPLMAAVCNKQSHCRKGRDFKTKVLHPRPQGFTTNRHAARPLEAIQLFVAQHNPTMPRTEMPHFGATGCNRLTKEEFISCGRLIFIIFINAIFKNKNRIAERTTTRRLSLDSRSGHPKPTSTPIEAVAPLL